MGLQNIAPGTEKALSSFLLKGGLKKREEGEREQESEILGRQVHQKVLNITYLQENANQNRMRYHLTPIRMAVIKKTKK